MAKKQKFRCLECGETLNRNEVTVHSSLGGNDDRYYSCISCLGVAEKIETDD